MKILHTSDWHLGLDFYGASLLRDQEAMVDRIADIAARERVGAVLLAGDVFDRAVVGADAMGVDNRAMRRSLERNGFQRRGVIHIADGTPRIAYEFLAEDSED